ncbi:MAG: S-layer homology domain-containing protein [Oscillospiraceae bacterium]|nr:S-layer homology domain-containing protein [Oscillospiraceae bacterium]
MRINGKIAGFSQDDSDDTQSYTIENPLTPFQFETIVNKTITVTNADDFLTSIASSRIDKVILGADIALDSGFAFSRTVNIDLDWHTLSCDSKAADKNIRVSGGNSFSVSFGNGTVDGFDNIIVGGHASFAVSSGTYRLLGGIAASTSPLDGTVTLSGGEFHLPLGLSGWVVATGGTYYMPNGCGLYELPGYIKDYYKLQGGRYKLYDTFDMDTLRSVCRNGYAPFADGEGWAAVRSHYHDYYKRFYNQSDGGVRYLYRCDGCDHTVSDWTLTGEEINTLIELNGGAFTDVWQWDREHPETATLRLTISDETYNAAIAAPYNMNAKALADIRDGGIVGEPGTPGETEHLDTFAQTDNNNSGDKTSYFNGTNVTLTHGDSVKTYGFLMTPDSPPATLTAKNGKKFYSVVFHVGAYKESSGHLVIDHDRVSRYDDGETIALNDLDTDTVTLLFDFPGGAVAIKSVDVVYADDGSHGTSIALRTERNGTDCYGRKASFTYRGHTYSKTFEKAAVASHNYQYDFDWKFGEERQIPYNDPRINWTRNYTVNEVSITGAHRTCTDCGHKEDPAQFFMSGRIDIVSPSYTANGAIRFPVTLRFADGSTHFDAYEYVIPMFPLVHYPAVPATCESWGNVEFWFDTETNQVYADAEGKQCITETNDPEHAPGAGIAPFKHLYDPKTDITWTWELADSTIFLNGNDENPIKSFEPHVTASFVCKRCGETVTVNEQRVSFDYVSGDGPTFESDGHLVLKGRVNLREYAYDGVVTDPETGVVIEGPETEVVIPKLERVYTKVEAKEPTFTEAGNIEYYACNDGKGYAKNDDGTYTELSSGSWIIPSHGFEEIRINDYKSDFKGTMADVFCQGGTNDGAWIENEDGTPTSKLTVTAKSGFQISKVVYHISYGEDRTDCARIDKGQLSVSDDGRTITVTDINSKSVTLSTDLSEYDIIPQDPDPEDPDWERIPDCTRFMVSSVEVFCGKTDETVYTMVPAKEATFTEAGNMEYYTGSDGKYYTRDGETYTEIAEGAWVIPAITLTKVEAKEPTANEAGNSEYYAGSNGKYYVKDGDSYREIRKYSWITFEEGSSWTHVEFVSDQYEYSNGQFFILVNNPNEDGAAVAEMTPLNIQPRNNNRLVSVTFYVSSNSENAGTVRPDPGNVTVETDGDIIRVRDIDFPSLILKSEKPIRISSLDICLEGSGAAPSEPDHVEFEPGGSNFHGSQVDVQTDMPRGEYGVLVDTQNAVRVFAREGKTLDRVVFFVRSGFENTRYAMASSGHVRVEDVERIEVTDIGKDTLTLTGDEAFYVGAVDVYYASGSGESGGSVIDKCTYRFERAEIYCNRPLIFIPNEAALTNGSVYITYDYDDEYGELDLTDAAAYAYRFYDQTGHEITLKLRFERQPEGGEMGLPDDMNLTARSYELGMDSLPLYIVIPENGGGESGGLTAGSLTRDLVNRMHWVTDLPDDFVQVDLETAKTWTGAPNEGRAYLIFAADGDSVRAVVFDCGKFRDEERFSMPEDIDDRLYSDEPVFYVTGRGSGQPAQTTYTRVPFTEPTPNKAGNVEYYVGSDGKYYEKYGDEYHERPLDFFMIPKVSVTRHAAVAATPNAEGNSEYYTGSDGKYYVKDGERYTETTLEAVTIAKLALVHHAAVTASCTENSNTEYWHDEVNGKYFSDANGEHEILLADTVVPARGHSFGEWVVTKPAQAGVKGEETRTCSVCGETESREIAALPDTPDTPAHEHKFTYTLSETKDTIIAVCENEGCTLTGNLTVSIAAPALTVYGGAESANATVTGGIHGVQAPTVEYHQGGTKLTAAPTDAGTYTASITVGGVTASVTYTIAKAAAGAAAAPTAKTLTYTGKAQALVNAGTPDGGTMQYCVGVNSATAPATGYSTIVPQGSDAKTYYVWYKVIGDSNHSDSEPACVSVTIGKASQSAPAAPTVSSASATSVTLTAVENGEYSMNGTDWQTSPTFTGLTQTTEYTFYQRLAADVNRNASPASASATIRTTAHTHSWRYTVSGATITATCADTDGSHGATRTAAMTLVAPTLNIYGGTGSAEATVIGGIDGVETPTVEYDQNGTKLTAAPTNAGSYTASITLGGATASVSYTIAKATPVVTAPKLIDNLVANGTAQALITAGTTTGGAMEYKLGANGAYSTAIPTAVEAGSYTVYYRVVGGENYDDIAEKSFAVPVAAVAVAVEPVQEAAKVVTPVTAESGAIDAAMTDTLSTVANSSKIDGIEDQAADAAKAAAAAGLDSDKRNELGYAPNEEVKLEATVKVAVQVKSALSENNSAATTGSAVASLKLDITPTVSVVAKSKNGSSDLPLVEDEPMKELTEEVEVVVNLSGLGFTPKLVRIDHEGAISYETVVDKGDGNYAWSQRQFSEVTLLTDERYGDITFLAQDGATIAVKSFGAAEIGQSFGVTAPTVSGSTFDGWTLNGVKLESATLTDELLTTLNNASHKLVLSASYKENSGSNHGTVKDTAADAATSEPTEEKPDALAVFDDVNASAWYADSIRWALESGVMNGVSPKYFNPDGDTTRAMVVTMLWRMEGSPVVNYAMDFADVESDTWYTEAVRWANAEGIVEGDGSNFNPNGAVTREQLATMLYRYAQYKGQGFTGMWAFPLNYSDAESISDWAYEPMCWMTMNGVINGIDGNLVPAGNATRAQVATMLMRYSATK